MHINFLVVANVILLSLSTMASFKKQCEQNGGMYEKENKYELCSCHRQKYFDPEYSSCREKSIEDKKSEPTYTVNIDNITDYASLLKAYEPDVCNGDKAKLYQAALLVMKDAVKYLKLDFEEVADIKKINFSEAFYNNWQNILEKINYIVVKDPHSRTMYKLFLDREDDQLQKTIVNIKTSLARGLIPLPIFGEDAKTFFKYSELIKAFFIGVTPIAIDLKSIKEFSHYKTHPFRPRFFHNVASAVNHDSQHALLLSTNRLRFGLTSKWNNKFYFSRSKCVALKNTLTNLAATPIKNNRVAKKTFNLALYYFLHEDNFNFKTTYKLSFAEFAFELWQARTGKSLPSLLLGENPLANRQRTEDLCHQIYELRKNNNFDFDFLKSFLLIIKNDDDEERRHIVNGIINRFATTCALVYEIPPPLLNEPRIMNNSKNFLYNLNDEMRVIFEDINKDFGPFYDDWLSFTKEFIATAELRVAPNIWQMWNRNK